MLIFARSDHEISLSLNCSIKTHIPPVIIKNEELCQRNTQRCLVYIFYESYHFLQKRESNNHPMHSSILDQSKLALCSCPVMDGSTEFLIWIFRCDSPIVLNRLWIPSPNSVNSPYTNLIVHVWGKYHSHRFSSFRGTYQVKSSTIVLSFKDFDL